MPVERGASQIAGQDAADVSEGGGRAHTIVATMPAGSDSIARLPRRDAFAHRGDLSDNLVAGNERAGEQEKVVSAKFFSVIMYTTAFDQWPRNNLTILTIHHP